MRNWTLPIIAVISVVVIIVLIAGCFLRLQLIVSVKTNTNSRVVASRYEMAVLDGGRVFLGDQRKVLKVARFAGISLQFPAPEVRMPDTKRLLWEFGTRRIRAGVAGIVLFVTSSVEFPVWVAILPSLVAPILWLRRRRRLDDSRGFAVIGS